MVVVVVTGEYGFLCFFGEAFGCRGPQGVVSVHVRDAAGLCW